MIMPRKLVEKEPITEKSKSRRSVRIEKRTIERISTIKSTRVLEPGIFWVLKNNWKLVIRYSLWMSNNTRKRLPQIAQCLIVTTKNCQAHISYNVMFVNVRNG